MCPCAIPRRVEDAPIEDEPDGKPNVRCYSFREPIRLTHPRKLAEEQQDKLVAGLRKSLRRSRNQVAILEAREEGRQLGRKELREEVLFNHKYPQLAPTPSHQVMSSILSSPVDEPVPTSATESTISQTTEEDEKTPVPVFSTVPNDAPAEETQRQLVAVQLELQVAKQELEELQERTREYKHIVQPPSVPGSPKGSEGTWEGDEEPQSKVETNALELDLHAKETLPPGAPDMQTSLDDFARRASVVEKMNRENLASDHKRAFDEANEKTRRREEKSRVANVAFSTVTPASQWAATLVTGRVSGKDPWHPEPGWVAPPRSASAAASMSGGVPQLASWNDRAVPTNPEPIPSTTDTTSSYPLNISSPTIIQPHPSWAIPRPENQTPSATILTFVPTACPCTYCRLTGAPGHGIIAEVGPPVIL